MDNSCSVVSESVLRDIVLLKQDMNSKHAVRSLLREALPVPSTQFGGFSQQSLDLMHTFLKENPIYFRRHDTFLAGNHATIYEGDNTNFLLDSKRHDASYQPFYSTWMISAAMLARTALELGFGQIVDIGSGDGRLAFAGTVLGIESYGVEIDPGLAELQRTIMAKTGVRFQCFNDDATVFDYSKLKMTAPMFFISALPESGEMLADAIIPSVKEDMRNTKAGVCFMGASSIRALARDHSMWGWGAMLTKHGLAWLKTINLPTQWTLDQPTGTPYVFTMTAP